MEIQGKPFSLWVRCPCNWSNLLTVCFAFFLSKACRPVFGNLSRQHSTVCPMPERFSTKLFASITGGSPAKLVVSKRLSWSWILQCLVFFAEFLPFSGKSAATRVLCKEESNGRNQLSWKLAKHRPNCSCAICSCHVPCAVWCHAHRSQQRAKFAFINLLNFSHCATSKKERSPHNANVVLACSVRDILQAFKLAHGNSRKNHAHSEWGALAKRMRSRPSASWINWSNLLTVCIAFFLSKACRPHTV